MMTASPGGSWSLAEPIFQDSTFPISGYSPGLRKEMNPLQLPMLLQIYLLATKQHIVHRKRVWQVNEARGQGEMPWMSSSALRQCSYGAVSTGTIFDTTVYVSPTVVHHLPGRLNVWGMIYFLISIRKKKEKKKNPAWKTLWMEDASVTVDRTGEWCLK